MTRILSLRIVTIQVAPIAVPSGSHLAYYRVVGKVAADGGKPVLVVEEVVDNKVTNRAGKGRK